MAGLRCLGSYDHLEKVLERQKPDEVISAIGVEDYPPDAPNHLCL